MSRHHQEWTDRFSEYLADALDESERARIETHLGECGACRDVLAGLLDVVRRAGELEELEPPRDLWPGISSAIGGPVRALVRPDDPSVIELPSARAAASPTPHGRVWLRRFGLAAAAAGLVAFSAGTTWWVANGRGPDVSPNAGVVAPTPRESVTAAAAGTPPADLASELAVLEEVLDVARDRLDPNTVRVLERNLGVIEQAIADSRQALALDPENAFLTEHLERMYRRKLVYLQDVVRVVQWSG